MIGGMPSPYGRAVAVAVFLFVLTLSPYAHAAETNALTINDPFTDVIQLWSAVLTSIESVANQLVAALQPQPSLTANNPPGPYGPKNLTPPALAASAVLATQPPPETATTSGSALGTSITPQQPQSKSPAGATSDQTTHSSFVKSPAPAFPTAPSAATTAIVTQDQFNAGLSALSQSLRQLIFQTASVPVVSGPGAPLPVEAFAPSQRIDQLTNTTLTNVTVNGITGITAANVPALQNYLLLTGGTLTGALSNSSTASSSFLGALGIGTSSPSDVFAVNGPIYLANVSPAATTNRLYSNAGSLYWAGSLIGGGSVGNWSSDGTNVWRAAGSVGIGTSSPGSIFSIQGVANWTAATSTYYSTGGLNLAAGCFAIGGNCLSHSNLGGLVAIANGGTGTSTGGVTNGVQYYNGSTLTNSSNFIFTGTNVGIGTTSPSTLLSIGGSMSFSGTGYHSFSYPTAANGGNFSTGELLLTNSVSGQNIFALHNTSPTGFSTLTVRGDDNLEHMAIGYANSAAGFCGSACDYLEISSFPMSGTNAPPTFGVYRSGYVNGSLRTVNAMRIENGLAGGTTDGRWYWPSLDSSTSTGTFIIDPLNDFVTVNNNSLVGNENNAYTPLAAIDDYGHANLGSNNASRSGDCTYVLCINENTSNLLRLIHATVVKVDLQVNGSGSTRRLDFVDSDNSSKVPLSIGLAGQNRLGVGTTTPGSNLSVGGSASIGADYGASAPTNGLLVEGQVGIGVTNPTGRLVVTGGNLQSVTDGNDTAYLEGSGNWTQIHLYNNSTGGLLSINKSGITSGMGNTDAGLNLWTNTNSPIKLGTNSAERVRIDASGNIGIGTTSPWRTLSVTGTVGFDGITSVSTNQSAYLCLSSSRTARRASPPRRASSRTSRHSRHHRRLQRSSPFIQCPFSTRRSTTGRSKVILISVVRSSASLRRT
jgi:hypothetical protein